MQVKFWRSIVDTEKNEKQGLCLADMGSFHIGGKDLHVTGKAPREIVVNNKCERRIKFDTNGSYHYGQIYVQYYFPQEEKGKFPIIFLHGGGMTGKSYESTPDGRPGWLNYFTRLGWKTYLVDAVERGRSGWCPEAEEFAEQPVLFNRKYIFERFRLGSDGDAQTLFPNSQFPIEAFANYQMEFVPRWTTSSDLMVDAYCELLKKVGPAIIIGHSQGATLGFELMERVPELVKGFVAMEPYGAGTEEGVDIIKNIPLLWIFGDYIQLHPSWKQAREVAGAYETKILAKNGNCQILDLPVKGINGNSHMLMMEKNNLQIADIVQAWLKEQGLCI